MIDPVVNEYAKKLIEASRTPSEFLVAAKVYFHHFNYAKFHIDLGGSRVKSVSFANKRYITDDKREQDQLDLIADIPGTFIYTLPDSEIDAAIREELRRELVKDVMQTAVATAAVQNQQFDPNAPIIPVNVQPVASTNVSVQQVPQTVQQTQQIPQAPPGVVGLANSFSGTQANDPISGTATTTENQTKSVTATDEAAARLAAMTMAVQNQK